MIINSSQIELIKIHIESFQCSNPCEKNIMQQATKK